jgi:hypothetical protein
MRTFRPLLARALEMTLRRTAGRRPPARRPRTRLAVESLEARDVPSALSVADVTVREGPTATGVLDPAGATALGFSGARDITFDNIPGTPHYHDLFVTNFRSNQILRFD